MSGNLPLNAISSVSPMNGIHTITVKKNDGSAQPIQPEEITQWTPRPINLNSEGLPKFGTRPWVTMHSVKNRLIAIN